VPHPDGSIWFTDPPYGDSIGEDHPDEAGAPVNPQGLVNPRIGAENAGVIGGRKRELPSNVYHWGSKRQARGGDHRGTAARPERHMLFA
jgi:gluconolactonase